MGQVPPKYIMPSAPYGQSDAVNAVNAVQPQALNPQTPLLPPNFSGAGQLPNPVQGSNPQAPKNPFTLPGPLGNNPIVRGLFPYS